MLYFDQSFLDQYGDQEIDNESNTTEARRIIQSRSFEDPPIKIDGHVAYVQQQPWI